jgi:hypothetical protein
MIIIIRTILMDKDAIIERIYYDPGQHGSLRKTYLAAKRRNQYIQEPDVKDWFYMNIQRKKNLAGYNTFVTNEPKEEYQMDLMFFFDLKDPEFKGGLLMVDTFTKFTTIIPITNNDCPTRSIKRSYT